MIKGTKELIQYNICGIYFLLENDIVVYVGQALAISARISKHIHDKKKSFDKVRYLECSKEELNKKEKYLIAHYHPKYNIAHNKLAIRYAKYLSKDIKHLTVKEFIECNDIKSKGFMEDKNVTQDNLKDVLKAWDKLN